MTRILVIDDEEDIISNIKDLLEIHDYEVLTANNGKAGIDKILSIHPDLIICDINMPVMDGLEMIKSLRKYPEFYTIPFLFLTANSNSDAVRLGMRLGADDYITKPYKSHELIKAVETRLNKSIMMKDSFISKVDNVKKSISGSVPVQLQGTINAIMTYSKLLQGNLSEFDTSEMSNFYEHIHDSGARLLRLVENYDLFNNLINFNLTNENISLPYSENPSETITNSASEAADHYQQRHLINYQLCNDNKVKISDKYLSKIIHELVDNAFKFSFNEKNIKIVSIISNNNYLLTITNYGRGFEKGDVGNIDAFVQFDRDSYEQQGLGLGLAIIIKILDIIGGRLQIDSVPNEYTTARVYLPLAV